MYPRVEFELTDDELKELLEASKPTIAIMVGGIGPSSPQENSNRAWQALGKKRSFDHMTVRPVSGKGQKFITAVPSEPEDQRKERLAKEAIEKEKAELDKMLADRNTLDAKIESAERKLKVHSGDPCKYCGVKHDDVAVGPCPGQDKTE